MVSRLPSLLARVLAAYFSAHAQMGVGGYWKFAADEPSVIALCVVVGICAFLLFALVELLVRAVSPEKHSFLVAALLQVAVSLCLGLWVYGALLPRTLATALTRDLPYVLCFGLLALGFIAGRLAEMQRESKRGDA